MTSERGLFYIYIFWDHAGSTIFNRSKARDCVADRGQHCRRKISCHFSFNIKRCLDQNSIRFRNWFFWILGMVDHRKTLEGHHSDSQGSSDHNPAMLVMCHIAFVSDSIKVAARLLKSRVGEKPSVIVATGSLHMVSSVLAAMLH